MVAMRRIRSVLRFALIGTALVFGVAAVEVTATSKEDIVFPVAELGGCTDEASCRAYCDQPENRLGSCFEFAKQHHLITQEQIDHAEQFSLLAAVGGGPGQCRSEEECYQYCRVEDNLDACLDFAEQNGLIAADKLTDARNIADVLRAGEGLPGDCRGKNACFAHCADPAHFEECATFAGQHGLATPELLEEMRKFRELMHVGNTPGGCASKEACESYCADLSAHFDECITFGVQAGYLSAEEAEFAKQAGGVGPGGCTTRESCETFCTDPANQQTCFGFAESAGVLSPEDIERYRQQYETQSQQSQQFLQGPFPPGGVPGEAGGGFPIPEGGFPTLPPGGFPEGGGYSTVPEGEGFPTGGVPYDPGALPQYQQYPQQYDQQQYQQFEQQYQSPPQDQSQQFQQFQAPPPPL